MFGLKIVGNGTLASEDNMAEINLFVRFRRSGESQSEVKAVARIQVGPVGGVRIVDPHTGTAETLQLNRIEDMSIQTVCAARRRSLYA
jgi:hypothetical protein